MKKLIAGLALVGACHSSQPETAPSGSRPSRAAVTNDNQTGAVDAATAVRRFLDAAKEQDLQAMGGLFGDADGPARDRIPRSELEKRELFMARCLRHDRYDIVGDAPNPGGGRSLVVNLSFRDLTRSSSFEVVSGPKGRWYVRQFDLTAVNDICMQRA